MSAPKIADDATSATARQAPNASSASSTRRRGRPDRPLTAAEIDIMRESGVPAAGAVRSEDRARPRVDRPHDAGGFRAASFPRRRERSTARRPTDGGRPFARRGGDDAAAGALSGGGQRPSGTGRRRWRRCRAGRRRCAVMRGPRFDRPVAPGGYAWWYVDALSDDRRIRPDDHRLRRQRLLALLRLGGAAGSARSLRASTSRSTGRAARVWAMTERRRSRGAADRATRSRSAARARPGTAARPDVRRSTSARRRCRAGFAAG